MVSNRGKEVLFFCHLLFDHVENYTVKQYGDSPGDPAEEFTVGDCVQQIKRYAARAGRGARGLEEELRDCFKIAHYACLMYSRILKDEKIRSEFE